MNLINALKSFAQFNNREVSCHTLLVFLSIAQAEDGLLQSDLPDKLNMSSSSISRNCCLLSHKTQKNKRGMNLIKRERHPHDSRMNILVVTDEGKHLYEEAMTWLLKF